MKSGTGTGGHWRAEHGFTLVELLVVMLILGLLAGIAIPAYIGQSRRARDAEAKQHVRTAATAVETYRTDNGGSYSGANVASVVALDLTLADVAVEGRLTVTDGADSFSVTVASVNDPNVFRIVRGSSGSLSLTCLPAGRDGCPDNGRWD